jgi:hypothetical protein
VAELAFGCAANAGWLPSPGQPANPVALARNTAKRRVLEIVITASRKHG